MSSPRRRPRAVVTLTVAALAAAGAYTVTAIGTGDHRPAAAAGGEPEPATASAVQVSLDDCGSGWQPAAAGPQELTVHNTDARPGELRVVGAGTANSGEVFGDLEPLGPGTTVTLRVSLAAGEYALECLYEDQAPVTGPTVTVTGTGAGTRGVDPIPEARLIRSTKKYERWVRGHLPTLQAQTQQLAARVRAGDLAGAKAAWLQAHTTYETLGAAYDAFGDLDGAINGMPTGLPRGASDPGFTGFHRLEVGLWGDGTTAGLRGPADQLATDVGQLQTQLASQELDPLTFSVRAHEISENLLRTALTGDDDLGSHSDLHTVAAGLDGTRQVLAMLRPALHGRYPGAHHLYAEVRRAQRTTARLARGAMGHEAVADWPRAQRERVDAAVAQLTEDLAPVAAVLEPRRTS